MSEVFKIQCPECGEKFDAGSAFNAHIESTKKQQEEIAGLLRDIGYIETQKHVLNHKYAGVIQSMDDFKSELEKEYGAVNISLEDGVCTPIEKESE